MPPPAYDRLILEGPTGKLDFRQEASAFSKFLWGVAIAQNGHNPWEG